MTRRQRLTLLAAILGSGVATIDGTIVNVALPAIERDLGGGLPAQQWVSNAYLLTLASLILIIGPLAGGWIVDQGSWRWIFALNVPLVAVTLVLIFAAVPRTAREAARSVDVLGAVLCVLGLAGFVFGLIEQPRYGWGSPAIFV